MAEDHVKNLCCDLLTMIVGSWRPCDNSLSHAQVYLAFIWLQLYFLSCVLSPAIPWDQVFYLSPAFKQSNMVCTYNTMCDNSCSIKPWYSWPVQVKQPDALSTVLAFIESMQRYQWDPIRWVINHGPTSISTQGDNKKRMTKYTRKVSGIHCSCLLHNPTPFFNRMVYVSVVLWCSCICYLLS